MKRLMLRCTPLTFLCAFAAACGAADRTADPSQVKAAMASTPQLKSNGPVQYAYDAAGRLTGVRDGSGESAQYVYDEAGNILQINRLSAGALGVFGVSPAQGSVGSAFTISGTGFDTTASNNVVKLNGTIATVSAATATQIVVQVPSSASTGKVSVTTANVTKTSVDDFMVALGGPIITSLSPSVGSEGTTVTLQGSNFGASVADNALYLAGRFVQPTSASTTQIQATVPVGARSGRVQVSTAFGRATAANDFFVLPTNVVANDVGYQGRIAIDGAPVAVSLASGNKVGLVLMDGGYRNYLGLAMTSANLGGGGAVQITLLSPNGATAGDFYLYADGSANVPPLPANGTYTLFVKPGSSATQLAATLTISSFKRDTLVVDGNALTYVTARPGQDGRFDFVTQGGNNLRLVVSSSTFGGTASGDIRRADGTTAASFSVSAGQTTSVDLTTPSAGPYVVNVDPFGAATGQMTLSLTKVTATNEVTLSVDGNTATLTLAAQERGKIKFTGTAGDILGVGYPTLSSGYSYIPISVLKPDGTYFADCNASSPTSCNLSALPVSGDYALDVNGSGANGVTIEVLVSRPVTGNVTIGGATATFATTRVGQDGRFTFTATGGQNATITLSNLSLNGAAFGQVLSPTGSVIGYPYVSQSSAWSNSFTNLAAGTYTIVIDPSGTTTGSLSIAVQ